MPPLPRRALGPIALFTALEVLVVGGLGAWLAVRLNFPYAWLTPLALVVYGAAGFYGCRAGAAGWLSGALVALFDAGTWAAFGGVGPQPIDPKATVGAKLATVIFVVSLGAVSGLLGGRLSRRRQPPTDGVAA
jgi:hypothetical protein